MTKKTNFRICFTTNSGTDDFEIFVFTINGFDKLISEMGELLEETYDEFERQYPGSDVVWLNRFWADDNKLLEGEETETEIYVSGQDAYASLKVRQV